MDEEESQNDPIPEPEPTEEPEQEPEPQPEPEPEPEPAPTPKSDPEPKPGVELPTDKPDTPPRPGKQDQLGLEFLYYSSVLKTIASTLSEDSNRALAVPWIKKLFRPEYQASKLREKRNRYLVSLTISLLNDDVTGIFQKSPPDDVLLDLKDIEPDASISAEWETHAMWQEVLLSLPENFTMMKCPAHPNGDCPKPKKINRFYDQTFQYLLYLTRPYAALLPADDKSRIGAWLQTLCTIHGEESCDVAKGVRNDYIMALLGYLHDMRIVGPFTDYPPAQLEPLAVAAKKWAKFNPVIDPAGYEANQFLLDQPIPEDGAFCYVALTGDLVASSL